MRILFYIILFSVYCSASNFTIYSYLDALVAEDLRYKNSNLQSKVILLESLIEQSRYNPDIYLEGYAQAEKVADLSKFEQVGISRAVGKINFNMRLYDWQRSHFNGERKMLFDALSSLELIDAKQQLQLLGIQIYIDLLQIQETIKEYNVLLGYQHTITNLAMARAVKGLGDIYDKTQAQNDLINIQLRLSDLKELLIQKEYLFRQAINMESNEPITLQNVKYTDNSATLIELQHQSLNNNARLKVVQKQYELSRSDIETEQARRGLSIDWISHYGYGVVHRLDEPYGSDDDHDWSVLLSAKIPLYERNDITLQVEQKKIKALQDKNGLEIEKRTLNRTVNRLYNLLQKYKLKHQLYTKQKEVLSERSLITYNRFKEALESYKPYSDSLRDMAQSDESFIQNSLLLDMTALQLQIITGQSLVESN